VVIVVVTAVWALNFGASVVVKSYTPSESINGIFMVIVGGLYAADRTSKRDDDNSKGEKRKIPAKKESEDYSDDGKGSGGDGT